MTLNENILKLYPEYHTIYGPYSRKEDKRKIVILYNGKKRTTRQLAKVKLEVKLGRLLTKFETVDHIDEDCTNDNSDNLQVLSRETNAFKGALKAKELMMICPICNSSFIAKCHKREKAGPFCSRSCTGKYGAAIQNGYLEKDLMIQPAIYYR